MTADARLVKLEADYWEALAVARALPVRDPRCDLLNCRALTLGEAIRGTLPDGPEGLMARWNVFRHSAEIAFQDETTLMQDFADFEAALRHVLGVPAQKGCSP